MLENVEVLATGDVLPSYARAGDAGADLASAEQITLAPGERALVATGVSIALPAGTVGFIVPRSGLAAKHGITVVNSPGTIDSGYRGELKVILLNTDPSNAFEIAVGDRIAQLIVMPYLHAEFVRAERLPQSDRGEQGFGSTGVTPDRK